jgi:hypothetical protein
MLKDFFMVIENLAKDMNAKGNTLYLYAHNAAKFDLIFVLSQLVDKVMLNRDIYKINVLRRNSKILAMD